MAKKQAQAPQGRLIRLLSLISYLKESRLTIAQIAENLDVCERSAYRYIKLFESTGVMIEQDFKERYYIIDAPVIGWNAAKLGYSWDMPVIKNNLQNNLKNA